MTENEKTNEPQSPKEYDDATGDRVEKKPKPKESPQQTHDDETHG